MSTFGYRRELGKYEDVDEDELLAGLSSEELQELERELADMDPDDHVPIGLRQKDQTAKSPTGVYSRDALLKYWDDENKKLVEGDHQSLTGQATTTEEEEGGQPDKSHKEQMTLSGSDAAKPFKDCGKNRNIFQKSKVKGRSPREGKEEEKKDECKKEGSSKTAGPQNKTCNGAWKGLAGNDTSSRKNNALRTETAERNNVEPETPAGNPIVIAEALAEVLRNDPARCEVNLNNVEDVSPETLLRFAEALGANTHVRVFSLANTHADDRVAFAVSKMLCENRSVLSVNIESNFVSGQGILALLAALRHNGTLAELRFHNQRHICGGKVEMEMVQLLRENTTLLKLGYQFDLPGPRMTATSILTRNQDQQRQKRLRQQKEQGCPAEASAIAPKVQPSGTATISTPKTQPSGPASIITPKTQPSGPASIITPKIQPPGPASIITPKAQPSGPASANRTLKKSAQSLQTSKAAVNHSKIKTPSAPPPPPPPPPSAPEQPPPEKNIPTRTIAERVKQQEVSNNTKGQSSPRRPKSKKVKNGANERESADILKELKNSLKPSLRKKREELPSRPLAPLRPARDDLMEAIRGSSIRSLKRVDPPQQTS